MAKKNEGKVEEQGEAGREGERENRIKPKPTCTNDQMVDLVFSLSLCPKSTDARIFYNKTNSMLQNISFLSSLLKSEERY